MRELDHEEVEGVRPAGVRAVLAREEWLELAWLCVGPFLSHRDFMYILVAP